MLAQNGMVARAPPFRCGEKRNGESYARPCRGPAGGSKGGRCRQFSSFKASRTSSALAVAKGNRAGILRSKALVSASQVCRCCRASWAECSPGFAAIEGSGPRCSQLCHLAPGVLLVWRNFVQVWRLHPVWIGWESPGRAHRQSLFMRCTDQPALPSLR